jgi:hypothetical protein
MEEVERLKALMDSGALSEEEFESEKRKLFAEEPWPYYSSSMRTHVKWIGLVLVIGSFLVWALGELDLFSSLFPVSTSIPTATNNVNAPVSQPVSTPAPVPAPQPLTAQNAVEIKLTDMTLIPENWNAWRFSDNLKFVFEYINKTGKTIRGFESTITFKDMFGKEILSITLDNTDAIPARGSFYDDGKYYELNQFMDNHNKLKNTNYEDIIFEYKIRTVLFEDGTRLE